MSCHSSNIKYCHYKNFRLYSGGELLHSQNVESFLSVSLEEEEEKGSNPEYYSQSHQHDDVKLKVVLVDRN